MSDLTDEQRRIVEQTKQRMTSARRDRPISSAIMKARDRLDHASIVVAGILDAGDRDPTWHESQELENAALALGRLLIKRGGR